MTKVGVANRLSSVRVGLVSKVRAAGAGGEAGGRRGVAGVLAQRCIATGSESAAGQQLLAVADGGVLVALLALLGRAAADGEDPEEAGADAEGGADPDDGEEAAVEVDLGAVERLGALDDAGDDGDGGGGQGASDDDEDGGDDGLEPRQARDGAGEVGEDADEQLQAEADEGDDEGHLGPLDELLEGLEGVLDILGQLDGGAALGDVAGVDLLRGPVELALGALPLLLVVGGAGSPERQVVVLVQAEGLGGDVVRLDLLDVELGPRDERLEAHWADAQVAQVDLDELEVLVGDAGEDGVEQRADGANGEEQWQGHAEEPTGTHCCPVFLFLFLFFFCFFFLFCVLFIDNGSVRQREGWLCVSGVEREGLWSRSGVDLLSKTKVRLTRAHTHTRKPVTKTRDKPRLDEMMGIKRTNKKRRESWAPGGFKKLGGGLPSSVWCQKSLRADCDVDFCCGLPLPVSGR